MTTTRDARDRLLMGPTRREPIGDRSRQDNYRFPESVHGKLKELREHFDCTKSSLVRHMITEYYNLVVAENGGKLRQHGVARQSGPHSK